ncbi:flagellar export protein FliJ [Aureliella helgolandensis]|uniref:Flagellar FliJ protein n=1 Tax=Aureliella helgolandensis TaxID=2527968 RepID=A0A518GEU5_9BACT|nr:flagellar export protein FliJ [Aureliella helgolandensis]QDV27122.1 flagellar biosynthesis chaperone [Aureliella helgolandensis]
MSEFKFGLQNVVKLRERERDAAAQSYRQALLAIEKLGQQIADLQAEHDGQAPWQSQFTVGTVAPQRIMESQRFQMHLQQEIAGIRSQIELIEAECEKRRQALVAREQALSSLEKLREQQHQAWDADQIRHEQIVLDEWAGFKHWMLTPKTGE